MIDCRLCINWIDEKLSEIEPWREEEGSERHHIFFGCRIYGNIADFATRAPSCPDFRPAQQQYAGCSGCAKQVPKVCISLGECINCVATDLWCVENCQGGELKEECDHWRRLARDGHTLIYGNMVFELYPKREEVGKRPDKPEGGGE